MFFNRVVAPRFLKRRGRCSRWPTRPSATNLPPLLDYLETRVAGERLIWSGTRLTLADIAVASPFANLAIWAVGRRGRWPGRRALCRAHPARPSFAARRARAGGSGAHRWPESKRAAPPIGSAARRTVEARLIRPVALSVASANRSTFIVDQRARSLSSGAVRADEAGHSTAGRRRLAAACRCRCA